MEEEILEKINLYQVEITRLQRKKTKMSRAGLILTVVFSIFFAISLALFIVSVVNFSYYESSGLHASAPDNKQYILYLSSVISSAIFLFFMFWGLVAGIVLMVIAESVFGTQINNRYKKIKVMQEESATPIRENSEINS